MSSTAASGPSGGDGEMRAQRALKRGLSALRKKQPEPAERAFSTAIALRPDDAALRLLRAAARRRLGRRAQALDDIMRAVELRPDDAAIHSAAAQRLVRLGLIERAASLLSGAIERAAGSDQLRLRVDLANICLRAGRSHRCIAELREAVTRDSTLAVTLAGWLRGFGDSEAALDVLDRAGEPGEAGGLGVAGAVDSGQSLPDAKQGGATTSDERLRLRANLLCDLGRYEEARASIEQLAAGSPEQRMQDARLLVRCGAFEQAQLHAEQACEGDAATSAWLLRGELALWRGDHEQALRCASELDVLAVRAPELSQERSSPTGKQDAAANADRNAGRETPSREEAARWRLRGAALLLAGRDEQAQQALEHALELAPGEGEALLWRGELLRQRGDLDASLRAIDTGITASHGYPLAGHLSRLITVTETYEREGVSSATMHPDAFHELLGLLAPVLEPSADSNSSADSPSADTNVQPARRLRSELLIDLHRALTAMAGNRTTRPSYVREGKLRPLDVPIHTRFESRTIQELIRVRDAAEVVTRLTQLAEARGDEPTIHCHIGEVYLWLGDHERADTAFKRALRDTEQVRWAYVGLCATEMIRHDYAEALRWCERGCEAFPPPGRTMYAYRGEVYRRMGELERARQDTRTMLELTPNRISSWINLALIEHACGHSGPLAAVHRRLSSRAPGLLDDACRELSLDPFAEPDRDTRVTLFEHLLAMMRGNRSSSFVSYFTAAGELRFVPQP